MLVRDERANRDADGDPRPLRRATAYITVLAAALGAILFFTLHNGVESGGEWGAWLVLVSLFAATELTDLSVHDRGARVGVTSCDAVLMPLVAGYSPEMVIVGVTIAMAVARTVRWRGGWRKWLFNVSSYGIAAGAAAAVWTIVAPGGQELSVGNAAAALASGVVFAALTHALTAIVVALVEDRNLIGLIRNITPVALLNVLGNLAVGLLFVSTFLSSKASVVVFPAPLIGMYFGLRGVARHSVERERTAKLYEATRALIAGPDAASAVTAFLQASARATGSSEAVLIFRRKGELIYSTDEGAPEGSMVPLSSDHPLADLHAATRAHGSLALTEDDRSPLLGELGVKNCMTAIVPGTEGGALAVFGREGADEYDDDDLKLLRSLAQEVALALDSFRLFAEVTEERERFRRIFTASKEGIALLDDRGVVRAFNPALEELSGLRVPAVIGRAWTDRIALLDRDGAPVDLADVLAAGDERELEMITPSDRSRWIVLVPGAVGVGDERGWVILVRDVTSQHELERAKSDFLATISHELRTPLTSIKGSLQLLSRLEEPPEETRRQMLGVMGRGADRLERLVLNLLFVSQLEGRESPDVMLDRLDLSGALSEASHDLLPDADVTMDVPDGRVWVKGDRERVIHCLEHLFENALKHGSGRVRVSVSTDDSAHILVRDQGPGVPPPDRERVFERFVRLGDVLTRSAQGAGVGLFIVRESVRAMGGDVWIEEDEAGRGNIFHLTLPLADAKILAAGSRLTRPTPESFLREISTSGVVPAARNCGSRDTETRLAD